MVASGQRAAFFDEGLQPFLKGVSLRGGAWHDLRFTMTPRKPRRHVLSDGHWRLERAVRGRVDDRDVSLADDSLNLELVKPSTRRQGANSGCDGQVTVLVRGSRCGLFELHA